MQLPPQSPVFLNGFNGSTIQFDMPSKISGRTYRIFVFEPDAPPPPSGYPVVVTDGNLTFPLAATLATPFGLNVGKVAVVVGVGYSTDDYETFTGLRNRDLTPSTPPSEGQNAQACTSLGDYGGAGDFHRFLIEELLPAIADGYSVNPHDRTLYGHSIAGMFTLNVLFNHPGSLRTFVASSPSIHWNERSVLKDEPSFVRKIQAGEAAPRVLILVGSKEQDVHHNLKYLPGMTHEQIEMMMSQWRMVDNARELGARLQQIRGRAGYLVRFRAFEDHDHLTALPASIGQALAFALSPYSGIRKG